MPTKTTIFASIAVVLTSLMLPLGQAFWKKAVNDGFNMMIFFSFDFIIGAIIYVVATAIWLFALSVFPLSKAYPFMALSYLFAALFGVIFFKDKLSLVNYIGYFLLIFGIVLISLKG